jgi:hypothetical protein
MSRGGFALHHKRVDADLKVSIDYYSFSALNLIG